jgi:aspartyl-tRNA(Asn)/glutamyl-tRNA(Gln) amidotransferase subunit A
VRSAIAHLESLGARVSDVRLPDHADLIDGLAGMGGEMLAHHRDWVRHRLGDYSESVAARLLAGQFVLGSDYAQAMRARRLLAHLYRSAFSEVDILAMPTVAIAAPTIADAERDEFPVASTVGDAGLLSRNTRPANATGLPAITVPCAPVEGLPVGLMLMGRAFDEATILRAAAAFEATTDFHRLRPPDP